jgi:hypothetical protein
MQKIHSQAVTAGNADIPNEMMINQISNVISQVVTEKIGKIALDIGRMETEIVRLKELSDKSSIIIPDIEESDKEQIEDEGTVRAPTNNPWQKVVHKKDFYAKLSEAMEASKKLDEEKEKRMKNIIIHGVTECEAMDGKQRKEHDTNFVINLCANVLELDNIEIENAYRLGRHKENITKPRPLLVRLKDKNARTQILSKRFMIKRGGEEFRNVFVNDDTTKEERQVLNDKIKEAKNLTEQDPTKVVLCGEGSPQRSENCQKKRRQEEQTEEQISQTEAPVVTLEQRNDQH